MYLTPGSSRRRSAGPGIGSGGDTAASGPARSFPSRLRGPVPAPRGDPRASRGGGHGLSTAGHPGPAPEAQSRWLDFRSPFPVDAAAGKKRVGSETGVSAGPGSSGPGKGPSPRGPSAERGAGWAASLAVRFPTFSWGWAGRAHAGKLVCSLPGRLPRRAPGRGLPGPLPAPWIPALPPRGSPPLGLPSSAAGAAFSPGRPLSARAHPLLTRPRPPHGLNPLVDHRAH